MKVVKLLKLGFVNLLEYEIHLIDWIYKHFELIYRHVYAQRLVWKLVTIKCARHALHLMWKIVLLITTLLVGRMLYCVLMFLFLSLDIDNKSLI